MIPFSTSFCSIVAPYLQYRYGIIPSKSYH